MNTEQVKPEPTDEEEESLDMTTEPEKASWLGPWPLLTALLILLIMLFLDSGSGFSCPFLLI